MNTLLEQIKHRFRQSDTLIKLLVINLAVYLVLQVFNTILFLFNTGDTALFTLVTDKLTLPASLSSIATQPWGIVTYMFLHTGFWHLIVNLVILYWTGIIFTEYLGEKKLLSTYVLGGLVGGLFFVAAYNILPVFDAVLPYANLRGASAGVIAVLVAIATLIPNYVVNLVLIGQVRLKYIAIFLIVLYVISIPNGNAGGQLAHLGGAFWGYFYITQLNKGNDLAKGFNNMLSKISAYLTGKQKVKVVYSNFDSSAKDEEFIKNKQSRQEIVDKILDKISKSGYSSLTKEEKEILFKASNQSD